MKIALAKKKPQEEEGKVNQDVIDLENGLKAALK